MLIKIMTLSEFCNYFGFTSRLSSHHYNDSHLLHRHLQKACLTIWKKNRAYPAGKKKHYIRRKLMHLSPAQHCLFFPLLIITISGYSIFIRDKGQRIRSETDKVENTFRQCVNTRDLSFYRDAIKSLPNRW